MKDNSLWSMLMPVVKRSFIRVLCYTTLHNIFKRGQCTLFATTVLSVVLGHKIPTLKKGVEQVTLLGLNVDQQPNVQTESSFTFQVVPSSWSSGFSSTAVLNVINSTMDIESCNTMQSHFI